jgi:predicted acetyltransferase
MSDVRALTAADMGAFESAAHAAFHEDRNPADDEMNARIVEPERALGVFEDGEIVATAAALTRELTVPGGIVPVAAVTGVGVVPGHTRRGHMTALMRRQIDDLQERGDAVAALWASEGAL